MAIELILQSVTYTHARNVLGTERILIYIFNVNKTEFLENNQKEV